jgi:Ca2+-binding RTX toxin-like protein
VQQQILSGLALTICVVIAALVGGAIAEAQPSMHRVIGTEKPDHLVGTKGQDFIRGLRGADSFVGLEARDVIYGDEAGDLIYAGPGVDDVFGGPGRDYMDGGRGDDYFYAKDSYQDMIVCGSGTDRLYADNSKAARDLIAKNCEIVLAG